MAKPPVVHMIDASGYKGLTGDHILVMASDFTRVTGVRVHMEIRLAEVQIGIVNIKQDLMIHKSDNRKDFETLRNEIHTDTRETGRILLESFPSV